MPHYYYYHEEEISNMHSTMQTENRTLSEEEHAPPYNNEGLEGNLFTYGCDPTITEALISALEYADIEYGPQV